MKLIEKIKDGVTDFIGFVVVIATLTKLWDKEITWVWDGLIGLAVGFGLFMLPDQVISDGIKRLFGKYTKDKNDDDNTPQ